MRTMKLIKAGGEAKEVQFKYEKLGPFCYYCGLLGHTDEFCEKLFDTMTDDGNQDWGGDLRAKTRKTAW